MPWNYPCTLLKALNEDARPSDHAITCLGKVDSHDTWTLDLSKTRDGEKSPTRYAVLMNSKKSAGNSSLRLQPCSVKISISVVLMPCKVKSFHVVRSALLLCLSLMALFLILATCMRLHCKNKILMSDTYPRQDDDHTARNVDLYQVVNRFSVEV